MIRNFPNLMREHRKKLRISISKLSQLTNISQGTLYKYERGEVSPNGVRLLKICAILKIDYKSLEI